MKKEFSAEQVIRKMRETEVLLGQASIVGEVSRKLGVTEQTYYFVSARKNAVHRLI